MADEMADVLPPSHAQPDPPRTEDMDRRRRRDDEERRDRERRPSSRDRRRDDDYRDEKRRRSDRDDDRSRRRDSPQHDHRDSRDSRERRRSPPRRRSPSPELSEEQREMRSVFVSQLSARVTDRELGQFFDVKAGRVREAKVITDRISRRSKGVGYVEFVDLESVTKALGLTHTKLLGIPIIVQFTEAEKNRQARDGMPGGTGLPGGLYVGSLNFALTESDIRQVFAPFGDVDLVDLHKDPLTGKSKGFAFVQFRDPKDAKVAMQKMNNFELAGREIKVGLTSVGTAPPGYSGRESDDRGGRGGGGGGSSSQMSFSGPREHISLDEGGGANFNNISRIELMQKLSRSERPADIVLPPVNRPAAIPQSTSRNVMLSDAFNAAEETERDWDTDLREDVKGEVETKYGKVVEIFVLRESAGEIFIRFHSVSCATAAVAGLHGRWFGGRQIGCQFIADAVFDASKP